MRLLHVVPTYFPATRYGGPIWSVHGLCKALAARGHDVHVATTSVDGDGDSDVPIGVPVERDGVKIWYFPSKNLRRLYWAPSMKQFLQHEVGNFNLVHLHSIFLWPTLAAARAARQAKVPYVVAPRGMLVKDLVHRKSSFIKNAWLTLFERQTFENAATLHVTSTIEADEARKFGYKFPPIINIPNGVDIPERETLKVISEKLNSKESFHISRFTFHRYLLFLGRINWKKGLDRLIPALKHVPEPTRLVLAGNDEENYRPTLEALAREHSVLDRIDFIGPVSGDQKTELLANAIALVLPSYSENFGLVVLEAMSYGTPVVVTPEVGAAEIVREGEAGVVVNGDPDKLGPALANLVTDPDHCREMGERGRQLVIGKYSWDAVAGRMEEAYKAIISGRTHA